MKFDFKLLFYLLLIPLTSACEQQSSGSYTQEKMGPATDTLRIETLRKASIQNGFVSVGALQSKTDSAKRSIGGKLFASKTLSLNGNISCQDCHLDKFGSVDGLPNAVGAGASGEGGARMASGGQIIPRNVLPLWGRGGPNFDTFFWDGKVQSENGVVVSQFGDFAPSSDPLVVAVHLPFVELREIIADTPEVRKDLVTEDVGSAEVVFNTLAGRVRQDPDLGIQLAKAYQKPLENLTFSEIGDAVAQFIRHNFRVKKTKLHRFVFENGPITQNELNGGITFYGRGRCASCHNGPYFSDFDFHSIPFPQLGFGKNGFGNDEGRYNVTFNPSDRFLFRTPPLYNATKTSPYGHSGSLRTLDEAIVAHFDPLRVANFQKMSIQERSNFYRRMKAAPEDTVPTTLSDTEVKELVAFISMLDF